VPVPRATLQFTAEGICPFAQISELCREQSAQLCRALKDAPDPEQEWHKAIPLPPLRADNEMLQWGDARDVNHL